MNSFLYGYFMIGSFYTVIINCDIVTLKSKYGGVIIGRKMYTIFAESPYGAFWKIPYAEPPVNELRFKPPKHLKSYNITTFVFNYSEPYEQTCANGYEEDCLHLSVFSPLSNNKKQLPILVWLHEFSPFHNPDFFIEENIIVVTVSYRTGIFGFLNTEDEFAEGNMGAKDILSALKWIKENISFFNGDSSKITVAGSSTSANLVASLPLSLAAGDLFNRVIAQSGCALFPADYRSHSFETLNKLYQKFNEPFVRFDRKKLYEILSKAPTKELLSASQDLFDSTEVRDSQRLINAFGPSVEISKHAFMNKNPLNVYKRQMGNNHVDVMMGYTSLESLYKIKGFIANKKLLKYLNYNFQYLLPFEGSSYKFLSKRYREIRSKIMDFYFINGTIRERSWRRYAKYLSDLVIYPIQRQARLHAEVTCTNVYLYRFSFQGSLNVGWRSIGGLDIPGAAHGDEICYLFRCKSVNDVYDSNNVFKEKRFIKKIVRMFANFVKFGNPTPRINDSVLGKLVWEPLQRANGTTAMNLGKRLKMVDVPERKRLNFWDNLRKELFS